MRRPQAWLTIAVAAVGTVALVLAFVQRRHAEPNQSLSGELVAYELSSGDLTLRTEDGDRHFVVRVGAAVHEGARTLALGDLISANGCRAKVWYQGEEGPWTARDIRISCDSVAPDEPPGSGSDRR